MSGPEANAGSGAEGSTRWRGFWGRLVIAVLIASAFMTSAVALVDRGITEQVAKIRRVKVTLAPPPPGGANYLIIGSDSRAFVDTSGDANDAAQFGDPNTNPDLAGQRSDTMMVAHVEPSAQRTFVVSFPRDLMVDVPGTPGKSQINSAYSQGGADLVAQTLKANFDLDINHYLEVDFKSFREIVDEIGNVTVYVPGKMRDDVETNFSTRYGGGCYALSGDAALGYVRARHLEIADPNGDIVDPDTGEHWSKYDDWSDLERIQRQQYFIKKLAGLAISRSLSDPFLALSLTDNVLKYITADQNLSRDDVNALVRAFRTVNVNDTNSIRFTTLPFETYPENPNRVQPAPEAAAVIDQLRTFGDDTPKPADVQPSQVTVRVTDATGTNVAPSVVEKLTEQGFHASQVQAKPKAGATSTSMPATVATTEIRYAPSQAEEAKALLGYFPDAKLVADASATDAVQLVLGTSFPGEITLPSTTTTVPPSTVPGAPATTAAAPSTTTTTVPPALADPCPQ
jgi:LCP family protein required for cell wall assembly